MSEGIFEKELKEIHAKMETWFNAFMDSTYFAQLTEAQQGDAGSIVSFFAEYSYTHLGVLPAEWTCDTVFECCTEILPSKVSAEPSFFQSIPPVLSAFFRFLAEQSLHSRGAELADSVEAVASDITNNAGNSRNWGPAKRFVMGARSLGVDVQDQRAMEAYIAEYNVKMQAHSRVADASRSAQAAPPDRYAPCPCGSGKKFKFCCAQARGDHR